MIVSWMLLVACGGGGVQGKVVDGLTKHPVPGPMKIVAKATTATAGIGCQLASADVGADGTFSLDSLCSGVPYALTLDQPDLWLADGANVPETRPPGPVEVVAWPAPSAAGLYVLGADGKLVAVKTAADVKSDRMLDSDDRVTYPGTLTAANIPVVADGQRLVLVGPSVVDEFTLVPVVPTGPHWLGAGPKEGKEKVRMSPWWYLGISWTDDTHVSPVEAKLDASKVVEKRSGERAARWIAADALPAGRYALMKPKDRRMYLVDFGGEAPPLPPDPEPPVPVP